MHVILVCFNRRFYEEYQKSFQKIALEEERAFGI